MPDIEIINYSSEKKQIWDDFVKKHASTWIDSTSHWIDFFENKYHYENYSFMIYKNNDLVGIFPLFLIRSIIFGKRLVSGPFLDRGGPFLNCSIKEAWPAIQEYIGTIAKKYKIDFIEIRSPPQEIPSYQIRSDYVDFYMDLSSQSIDDIWKSLDKKLRNSIRKAKKHVNVGISNSKEDFFNLYKLHLITMKSLGSIPLDFQFFEQFWSYVKENKSFIIFASYNNKIINTNLIVLFKEEAKYELGVYLPDYRDLQANSLLIFEAIKKCKDLGCKKFVFGRTLKDSNVYTFKKRWAAIEFPINYYYKLYKKNSIPSDLRKSKLAFLSRIWPFIPVLITKPIGNYLRKKICL